MFKPRISASLILSLLFSAALLAGPARADTAEKGLETAIFAGGCFWCVESDFDAIPGVLETVSGYTGGTLDNPTYTAVTEGGTGHYEAVRITFDADTVSYAELVAALFRSDSLVFITRPNTRLTLVDDANLAVVTVAPPKLLWVPHFRDPRPGLWRIRH